MASVDPVGFRQVARLHRVFAAAAAQPVGDRGSTKTSQRPDRVNPAGCRRV